MAGESEGQRGSEQKEFITTEFGATHFINGTGSVEDPYDVAGGTQLNETLSEAREMAISKSEQRFLDLFGL